MTTYQLGWFSTGRDKAARDLLTVVHDSIEQREIKASIASVFCSREPGESRESDLFLELVDSYQIPLVSFSYQKFKARQITSGNETTNTLPLWRLDYDSEVMARLQGFQNDLCVLAGYMLIVGPEMCQRYDMTNLHPAAPDGPKGTWQEVIWQLIEGKALETGVMMHLVTPKLDMGPVVAYCTFPIRGRPFDRYWDEIANRPSGEIKKGEGVNNPLFKTIRQHGLAREFPLIVATIKVFSQGKIKITADKKVVDAGGKPIEGYDLTEEINQSVKGVIPQ